MAALARFELIEHGSPIYREAVALRDEMLRNPWGRVTTAEEEAAEEAFTHVAGFVGAELCATCLLVVEVGRIRMKRVAVAPSWQGMGIGTAMLEFCEAHARGVGASEMYAHARDSAVRFYERAGYGTEGEYFDEVGIPHLLVRKRL